MICCSQRIRIFMIYFDCTANKINHLFLFTQMFMRCNGVDEPGVLDQILITRVRTRNDLLYR